MRAKRGSVRALRDILEFEIEIEIEHESSPRDTRAKKKIETQSASQMKLFLKPITEGIESQL